MNNKTKNYICTSIWNILFMMLSGSVLQTFLLEKRLSEQKTNIYFSFIQIIQIVTIIIFSAFTDKIKNPIKAMSRIHLIELPFIVLLLFISLGDNQIKSSAILPLILTTLLFNIAYGIYNVISYKLPYLIFDMKEYGKILSFSGVLVGVFCFSSSVLLSFSQQKFGYLKVMRIVFVAAILLFVCFITVFCSYKQINTEAIKKAQKSKFNFLTDKSFSTLIIPNILRGFCAGIIGMAVTMGYYLKCIDSSSASVIVILTNASTILGCAIYSVISNRINDKKLILISSIAVFIFMPLMLISKNTLCFLIFYAIAYFL